MSISKHAIDLGFNGVLCVLTTIKSPDGKSVNNANLIIATTGDTDNGVYTPPMNVFLPMSSIKKLRAELDKLLPQEDEQ